LLASKPRHPTQSIQASNNKVSIKKLSLNFLQGFGERLEAHPFVDDVALSVQEDNGGEELDPVLGTERVIVVGVDLDEDEVLANFLLEFLCAENFSF
jgi:hypothetical protein